MEVIVAFIRLVYHDAASLKRTANSCLQYSVSSLEKQCFVINETPFLILLTFEELIVNEC